MDLSSDLATSVDLAKYRSTSMSAVERLLADPSSLGMPDPTYGNIGMRRIWSNHRTRPISTREVFKSSITSHSLKPGDKDLYRAADFAERISIANSESPQHRRNLRSSPRLEASSHFSSTSGLDREALLAAQRELMKTHQEILALEEEIRKRSNMLDFLSAGQRDSVLTLFGPSTEAGRQLRKIFGTSQQNAAKRVNYPPTVRKENIPSECTDIPRASYRRRYRTKREEPLVIARPGRRPATKIIENMSNWTQVPKPDPGKDLSSEKSKLQERFQFSDANIVVPSNEEIKQAMKSCAEERSQEDAILAILRDVCEAQRSLDMQTMKDSAVNGRLELENRVKRGLRELELLNTQI